jgi:hypothetical protein
MNQRHPQIMKLLKNPVSLNIYDSDREKVKDKVKMLRGDTKK